MIDFTLERRISDLNKLKERWGDFREYYRIGEHKKKYTQAQEDEFLECKKNIALLHEEFIDTLPQSENKAARQMKKTAQVIIDHVIHCVSIKHVRSFYDQDHKLFEQDWNGVYLLLNETIGLLEDRREQIANMSHARMALSQSIDSFKEKTTAVLKGPLTKLVVVLALLIGVPYGLHVSGVFLLTDIPTKIPFLAKPYNFVVNQLRKAGLSVPYTSLDDVQPDSSGRPSGYSSADLTSNQTLDITEIWELMEAMEFSGNKFVVPQTIKDNVLTSRHERWRTGGGQGNLDLYLILLKNPGDVRSFGQEYTNWLNGLSDADRELMDGQVGLGRSSNVLFIAISANVEAREHYIKNEYGAALVR